MISGLKKVKADAVHPGYGFLSENAKFAKRVEEENIIFIGPKPETILQMGDKTQAIQICKKINVPVIPSFKEVIEDPALLKKNANSIGYPLMIKAAFGGGGRGIRICKNDDEFLQNLDSAKREAKASFNSDQIFLESYFEGAKHVEVQILGDGGKVIHLYERECSVQRRHQKIIEEAPCTSIDKNLKEKMYSDAILIAKEVGYIGVGTVEFLVHGNEYYFLEMNTRLQVEHPVTEMILGVDLVELQIQAVIDKKLPLKQEDLIPKGHAIECRVYAEKDGVPSTGKILYYSKLSDEGVRYDDGFSEGHTICQHYDSMFSKIILFENTRKNCINKFNQLLAHYKVFGVETNLDILKNVLTHPVFISGDATTDFKEYYKLEQNEKKQLEFLLKKEINKTELLHGHKTAFSKKGVLHEGKASISRLHLSISGSDYDIYYLGTANGVWIHSLKDKYFYDSWFCKYVDIDFSSDHQNSIISKMPGKITSVNIKKNQILKKGDVILVLEAMKMEYVIKAEFDLKISKLKVKVGDKVSKDDVLVILEKI